MAGVVLNILGVSDMRASGRSGSPLLMLGGFPALLCPIFFVYYVIKIGVFRDLQLGRTAIARRTVPEDQFNRLCEEDRRTRPASRARQPGLPTPPPDPLF